MLVDYEGAWQKGLDYQHGMIRGERRLLATMMKKPKPKPAPRPASPSSPPQKVPKKAPKPRASNAHGACGDAVPAPSPRKPPAPPAKWAAGCLT